MEVVTTVKVSDLEALHAAIAELRLEIKELKEIEKEARAFSIQHTAEQLDVHHCTVRKFIREKKLFAKYIDGTSGKCMVPLWSITAYLKSTKNSNQ